MPDTPQFLYERLLDEGKKSLAFFQGLSDEIWDLQIYTDGSQWSIRQILAHFVSTESAINRLIENILAGGSGASEDFNIDDYNERKVAELKDINRADLLKQFQIMRRTNAEIVAQFNQEDLDRIGRHPFLGVTSLTSIIKLLYRHNQIHLRDIRRALS